MNRAPVAVRWGQGGVSHSLRPVTLDRLGKDEKFLEDALAANPELLGIQSRRSGIRGPYAVFQQVALPTPASRAGHLPRHCLTGRKRAPDRRRGQAKRQFRAPRSQRHRANHRLCVVLLDAK